jgi:hypothetical protein
MNVILRYGSPFCATQSGLTGYCRLIFHPEARGYRKTRAGVSKALHQSRRDRNRNDCRQQFGPIRLCWSAELSRSFHSAGQGLSHECSGGLLPCFETVGKGEETTGGDKSGGGRSFSSTPIYWCIAANDADSWSYVGGRMRVVDFEKGQSGGVFLTFSDICR